MFIQFQNSSQGPSKAHSLQKFQPSQDPLAAQPMAHGPAQPMTNIALSGAELSVSNSHSKKIAMTRY